MLKVKKTLEFEIYQSGSLDEDKAIAFTDQYFFREKSVNQ